MGDELLIRTNIDFLNERKNPILDWVKNLHFASALDNKPRTIHQIRDEVLKSRTGQSQTFMEKLKDEQIIYFKKRIINPRSHRWDDFYQVDRKIYEKIILASTDVQKIIEILRLEGHVQEKDESAFVDFISKGLVKLNILKKPY